VEIEPGVPGHCLRAGQMEMAVGRVRRWRRGGGARAAGARVERRQRERSWWCGADAGDDAAAAMRAEAWSMGVGRSRAVAV